MSRPPSSVQSLPPPPPLLLTKRVTTFLRQNLSPQTSITTSMLTTPSGNLLAHASSGPQSLPASVLRRQCAVAASISRSSPAPPHKPITVQMADGSIFVIRRLKCGMLFVAIGGHLSPSRPELTSNNTTTSICTTTSAAARPTNANEDTETEPSAATTAITSAVAVPVPTRTTETGGDGQESVTSNPSSVLSTGTAATGASNTTVSPPAVIALRRQAEELARWLDDKLGALYVPEEGIGIGPPYSSAGGVASPGYGVEVR